MDKAVALHRVRYIKRIVGIIAALVVFVIIVHMLDYMYVNSADSAWERILWHHFYDECDQIDNLYLGSSHVLYDIEPMMLDDLNGQYNFNLATPGQLMNGTYFLLREADRNSELSHVYIELFYYYNMKEDFTFDPDKGKKGLEGQWHNTDYMRMSGNRMAYIISVAGPDGYIDMCLPFCRYRENLGNWDYIKEVMSDKQDQKESDDYDWYERGYYYTEVSNNQITFEQEGIMDEDPMWDVAEEYLRKSITYCQEREIPLTLFVSPIYALELISTENYDNYVNYVRAIAEEYNVEFYDFNLAREEYLPIQNSQYFLNTGHLNNYGANIFTPFFYEVVSGNESDNNRYFYDSYAEKLQNTAPEIYGVYYRIYEDAMGEEQMKTVWIASNRESNMEYRIIMTPYEGSKYMIQDFDENKEFTLPMNETGICTIEARMKETPDDVQTMEIYI